MSLLELKLAATLPAYVEEVRALVRKNEEFQIGSVTAAQAYGGMRGVNALVCDTSEVHPERGLIIRGILLDELKDRLPEEIFWLLLTGDLPAAEELADLQVQVQARSHVPPQIWAALRAMPEGCHPMAMLSAALTMMYRESVFAYRIWSKNYSRFWALMLEDSLRLLGKLPLLAAGIYRICYHGGELIEPDPHLDMAGNLCRMLGLGEDETLRRLVRRYLVVHSDHESGNATAYATLTVASALNDPYLSLAAGMNALAGPLHGLAAENALAFLQSLDFDACAPDAASRMEHAIKEYLQRGRVLHGFGHAVLRVPDPRYLSLHEFARLHYPDDELIRRAVLMCEVAPEVLKGNPRIRSPWPNIDAISGSVLTRIGITQPEFFTVMFGVGLSIGLLAQLVLARALDSPMIRPKSITSAWVREFAGNQDGGC